jgi:hypothetical protein
MRCPSCGSEIDGPGFATHFALCEAGKATVRSIPEEKPMPITAREAEGRARGKTIG